MNWINWFGLGIVLLLLIPNAVYAAANKNTQPPRTSRILGLAEQAGRYGCMFLMIFHAGLTELVAQVGDFRDRQATVVNQHDRLRTVQLIRDFRDDGLFGFEVFGHLFSPLVPS